jgi:hypothetical protein
MEYLLLLYANDTNVTQWTQQQQQEIMAAYQAYTQALRESNVLLGFNRLRPASDATTVRQEKGKSRVLDGPYADTKEQLGGYYLLKVADLDAAISWANRCPHTTYGGTIEVRPVWMM